MAREQTLEKKLEQVKWQFPNHVVFKHNGKVFHFDPDNFDRDNIFTQTGLKVYRGAGNVALYDPEYFKVNDGGDLIYRGIATEKIPQPINLKRFAWMFYKCTCETIDLSDWDFSEITSMRYMFAECVTKTVILGDVDFSKCESFYGWFFDCMELQEVVLGNYKVLSKDNIRAMFHGCDKLFEKYNKTKVELANIFKSGQWNSLQTRMEVF